MKLGAPFCEGFARMKAIIAVENCASACNKYRQFLADIILILKIPSMIIIEVMKNRRRKYVFGNKTHKIVVLISYWQL